MSEPIKSGDRAEVITGLGGPQSPNVGLHVLVGSLQGEHSRFGRIWRCSGADIRQLTDGGGYQVTGWADFPASWLRKLPPPGAPAANDHELETATSEGSNHG